MTRYSATTPATTSKGATSSHYPKALAKSETVQDNVDQIRIVGNRTYFLRDETWVNAEYADEETIDIVVYSEAYFDLVTRFPEIASHLAIGKDVILRIGKRFLHIGAEGSEELTESIIDELGS